MKTKTKRNIKENKYPNDNLYPYFMSYSECNVGVMKSSNRRHSTSITFFISLQILTEFMITEIAERHKSESSPFDFR